MSDGELTITGYVYPEVYIPQQNRDWYHSNNAPFANGDIKRSHEILTHVKNNPMGIVFDGRFDNYTNGTNNVGLGFEDGFFDMIILAYRSGGAFTSLGSTSFDPGDNGFDPDPIFLGGLEVIDNYASGSGVHAQGFSVLAMMYKMGHEVGHRQFGYYHEATNTSTSGYKGNSMSIMEASAEAVTSMSGSDRVKLGWLNPDTLDVSTFTHTPWSLDDAMTSQEALYVQSNIPAQGDVLIENRRHSNFWDRPPDGTNADGDNGDHHMVEEGLYIYKAGIAQGGLGGRYSSMENTGGRFRDPHSMFQTFSTVANIAYTPGDAYTPFSTYRYQSPSPKFDFYVSSTLDDTFALTDIQQQGAELTFNLWSNYLLDADNGDKVLATNYQLEADSTLARLDSWNLGGTFRFEDGFVATEGNEFHLDEGARIEIATNANVIGTSSTRVIFDRLDPLKAWDRIYIDSPASGSNLEHVDIDGATVGVEVTARSVTIDNATFSNNTTGILTDFFDCPACSNFRSSLTLTNSAIYGPSTTGFHARHVNATVINTTISGNGANGILVEDSDLVPFTDNIIAGNTTGFIGSGISIISGGDPTMGPSTGTGGLNQVFDNTNHELRVAAGGTLLVGTLAAAGFNSIYKSSGNPTPSARYIKNATGVLDPIMAESTWWGDENGPPAGAFAGSVDSNPFLFCDPHDPSSCPPARSGSSFLLTDAPASSGRGQNWHVWLKEEILSARQLLIDSPAAEGMAAVVYRLAPFQRLDREDELNERDATMALIGSLRLPLNDTPTDAVRAVAEAALVSEVRASLYEQNYDVARDLLAGYGSDIRDGDNQLVLKLAVVSLYEQESDYVNALSHLQGIIASLPREATDLVHDLEQAAAVIARSADQQAGGRSEAPVSGVTSAAGETEVIITYALDAAYPNPFNPNVTVPFALPDAAHVEVVLYDVLGRRVAVLANSLFDTGRHTIRFDGSDLASGVYVLRAVMEAETGGIVRTFTQRLTLLK